MLSNYECARASLYRVPGEHKKKEAKEFFQAVLLPAADVIANCSFQKSRLYQVGREQNISFSDDPGDWAEIGFQAVRLMPDERPSIIQCNV